MDYSAELAAFERAFGPGGPFGIVRAPGRVNLIGEHTDYNDGYVLPVAIEPEIRIVFRPKNGYFVKVVSTAYPDSSVEYSMRDPLPPWKMQWANYLSGVVEGLRDAGLPQMGMDVLISSTIPKCAGLSSSAALCIGFSTALLERTGLEIPVDIVVINAQQTEHLWAGVPCGIMDPMIVAAAKADHAMLLDCRTLQQRHLPLDPDRVRIVIVNSGVSRELADSEYARRRAECDEALVTLQRYDAGIRALRDVTPELLDTARSDLSDALFRRCRHVVSENARTLQAARCLEVHDYGAFGELMLHSHASLRDDYEVSIPQLDFLVEQAISVSGVFGARMTGGGFGGCVVAIVRPDAVTRVTEHLSSAYSRRCGILPQIIVTRATAGASVVSD